MVKNRMHSHRTTPGLDTCKPRPVAERSDDGSSCILVSKSTDSIWYESRRRHPATPGPETREQTAGPHHSAPRPISRTSMKYQLERDPHLPAPGGARVCITETKTNQESERKGERVLPLPRFAFKRVQKHMGK